MSNYGFNIYAYLVISLIFATIIPVYILYFYANKKVFNWHTYITIFLQYFCALEIILLVPLDISLTIIGRRTETNHEYYEKNKKFLLDFYIFMYLIITILSNIVLTFQEKYNTNGFFTIFSKTKNVLKNICLQICALIAVTSLFFGILVATNVVRANIRAILLTIILITNTSYTFALMLLMGYGLMMFPIYLWNICDHRLQLINCQHEAAKEFNKLAEYYSELFVIINDVHKTNEILRATVNNDKKLITYMDILLNDIPVNLRRSESGRIIINKHTNSTTVGSLAEYRQKLYWCNSAFTTSQGRLNALHSKICYFEDLIESGDDTNVFKLLEWSLKPEGSHIQYVWYLKILPVLYKILSIVCAILSCCSYLGIIGIINNFPYDITPYFIVTHNSNTSPNALIIFIIVTINYACIVTTWALFQMRISKYVELIGHNSTWPIPMSLNSRFFSSLTCPLAFFYLGWIHENGITYDTFVNSYSNEKINVVFTKFYEIKMIPVINNVFNIFFPICLICVSILAALNYLNAILIKLRCGNFQFGQETVSDEILEEGKEKMYNRKKMLKSAYKKMLQDENNDQKSFFMIFSKGINQQSKFNCFIGDNTPNYINNIELRNSTTMSPIKIKSKIEERVGSFTQIFEKYSTKIAPIEE
jgi:hypothetical protein